jgi:hypothetical protein
MTIGEHCSILSFVNSDSLVPAVCHHSKHGVPHKDLGN